MKIEIVKIGNERDRAERNIKKWLEKNSGFKLLNIVYVPNWLCEQKETRNSILGEYEAIFIYEN